MVEENSAGRVMSLSGLSHSIHLEMRSPIKKLRLDFVMSVLILLAFAYPFTGNMAHELIGLMFLAALLVHAKWNRKGFLMLINGKCSQFRRMTKIINQLLLLTALLMILGGLPNSAILFSLVQVETSLPTRELHTASAHWFLILMSIHLGVHWQIIMAMGRHRATFFFGVFSPFSPSHLRITRHCRTHRFLWHLCLV